MTGAELAARLALHERGMKWLADKLGVSATSVWRWVHEREPVPPARAEQIERLLPRERSTNV